MESKTVEMAVDLTKAALTPTTISWLNSPEKVTDFLEKIAKKLHELIHQT